LRELKPQFAAAGITVRFVVIGTPEEAKAFCAKFGDASLCLADPKKETYKAMGLEQYNLLRLFTDKDLGKRRLENKAAGFSQNWGATKLANAAQLPGAAVFDASGEIRWVYRGKHPGDLPPMVEMLESARSAL
jgi:AhpC/TSA antioxidant enzyme